MNTTTTPATWRDYIDELTPSQVRDLERTEAELVPAGVFPRESLLRICRSMLDDNAAQARYAHIPQPADAIDAPTRWWDHDDTRWSRTYTAHRRTLDFPRPEYPNHDGTVTVEVVGTQFNVGGIERHITVNGGGLEELTSAQCREVARALMGAADALERCWDRDSLQRAQDAADEAWSAVPVDSDTRPCCGGLGGHTSVCGAQA